MIIGNKLENIPWENRPDGCEDIVWRYSKNPIIGRHQIKGANSIFNSAVIAKDGVFVGVFRSDNKAMEQKLYFGTSSDGLNWDIQGEPIQLMNDKGEAVGEAKGYDPRLCFLEDRYYITWCNQYHGPTIGIAYTYDFKSFVQLENAFLPFNRNGVLFPRKINNKFLMLSRPSDNGHTPFGDIYISQSPDMEHWGVHRHVMSPEGWAPTKIGAGPIPIGNGKNHNLLWCGGYRCSSSIYSGG